MTVEVPLWLFAIPALLLFVALMYLLGVILYRLYCVFIDIYLRLKRLNRVFFYLIHNEDEIRSIFNERMAEKDAAFKKMQDSVQEANKAGF